MPATRYKVQQFAWGFRMYDSQTEQPAADEIARFDVNLEEAEMIEQGAMITLNDEGDDVIVRMPTIFDAPEGSLLP